MTDSPSPVAREAEPWLVSLRCWLCLVVGVGVYAVVALAPSWHTYEVLHRQELINQLRLVEMERQVQQMDRVADALQHDSAFAAALARVEFETGDRPGEQRIPVESAVSVGLETWDADAPVPVPPLPWYYPILRVLTRHRPLQSTLLAVAAAMTIGAFVALPTKAPAPRPRFALIRACWDRYRLPPKSA